MGAYVRKQLAKAVFAAVALAPAAARADATPVYFNPGNGHYYRLTTGTTNWQQAEAQAQLLGGHLVSITSQAEQDFIVNTFLSGSNSRTIYWIGATDQSSEGTFSWSNGDQFGYAYWHPGEPNNCPCGPGGEHFGAINWHYALGQSTSIGTWNDTSLTGAEASGGAFRGIIEFDSNPTPVVEPVSLLLVGTGWALIAYHLRRHTHEPSTTRRRPHW